MYLSVGLIHGMALGIEYVQPESAMEVGMYWAIVVDIVFLRFILGKSFPEEMFEE